jgi:hypothetical protein
MRDFSSMWQQDCKTQNGGFMRNIKFIAPALVLAAGMVLSTSISSAKPADMKKTGQKCTVCHATMKGGKTDLTAIGKYYKEKGTLEGYAGPDADKIVKKK